MRASTTDLYAPPVEDLPVLRRAPLLPAMLRGGFGLTVTGALWGVSLMLLSSLSVGHINRDAVLGGLCLGTMTGAVPGPILGALARRARSATKASLLGATTPFLVAFCFSLPVSLFMAFGLVRNSSGIEALAWLLTVNIAGQALAWLSSPVLVPGAVLTARWAWSRAQGNTTS